MLFASLTHTYIYKGMADVPIFIRCGGSWINLPDGSEAYSGGNVASLCVPKDVKYQEFLHILYDRFGINPDEFAVTTRALYKTWVPSSIAPYKPADIGNDGDLKAFIYINTNYVSALGGLTPMCITSERRGPKDPRNNQIRNNQVRDVNDTLAAVRERNNQVSDVNDTLPAVQEKTIGRATSTGGPYDPRNNPVSDVNGTLPAVRERAAGLTNSTGGPRDPRNNPVSDFHDTLPAVQEKIVGRATSTGGSCDPRNNPVGDVNGTLPAVRERAAGLTNSTGGPRDPRNNPVSDFHDTLPAVQEKIVGCATSTGGSCDPRNNPVGDVNGTLPAVRERAAGLTNSTGGPRDPRNNPVSDFHDTLPAVQEKTVGRATSKGGSCDPRNNPVSDVNGTLPAVRERTAGLPNSTGGPRDPRNNPVSDVNDTLPAVRERTVGHTTSTGPEHCSSTHHNEDPKHNCSDSESTMRVNKISGKECRRNYPEEPANVRKDFGAGDLQSQAHSRQRSNSLAHQHNISSLPSFSKGLPAYMRFENPFDTSLNSGNSNVYVGQIFNNKQDLRKKLSMMALRKRFQFKTLKSSKDRFEVKCLDNQCKWRVRATSDKNNGYFQVRRIDTVHSCEPVQLEKGHRQATSKLIAELVKDRIYGPKNI